MTPIVLVGGVNRSGTTLVRQMLDSHSQLALPPTDVDLFEQPGGCAEPVAGRSDLRARLEGALAWPKLDRWGLDREELLRAAEALEPSPRSLMLALLGAYARRAGKPRLGQKTPHYEQRVETFDAWFGEDYRFVQVVRHPLDTYASGRWYAGHERPVYTEGWAAGWVRSTAIGIRRSVGHPGLHRLVRYEDLVARPEAWAAELCGFLGLPPEVERMLAMDGYQSKDSSSFAGEAAERAYAGGVRRSDAVDRRSRLDETERRCIEAVCGPLAAALGYDLGMSGTASPARRAGVELDAMPFGEAAVAAAGYLARRAGAFASRRLARWRRRAARGR